MIYTNPFDADDEDDEDEGDAEDAKTTAADTRSGETLNNNNKRPLEFSCGEGGDPVAGGGGGGGATTAPMVVDTTEQQQQVPVAKRRRWDTTPAAAAYAAETTTGGHNDDDEDDALDQFMEKLQSVGGAYGPVIAVSRDFSSMIDVSGSVMRQGPTRNKNSTAAPHQQLHSSTNAPIPTLQHQRAATNGAANALDTNDDDDDEDQPLYQPTDWLSDAGTSTGFNANNTDTEDDEEEEEGRRALIEALTKAAPPPVTATAAAATESSLSATPTTEADVTFRPQLKTEVVMEKARRHELLKDLEAAAAAAEAAQKAGIADLGRDFFQADDDSGVVEEAARNLEAAKSAAPTALSVLAELNKKKELTAVDHVEIDYLPFQKNLYLVTKAVAALTHDQVTDRRAKLRVRVRGHGAPAPVATFDETGLPVSVLQQLASNGKQHPFPFKRSAFPAYWRAATCLGSPRRGRGKRSPMHCSCFGTWRSNPRWRLARADPLRSFTHRPANWPFKSTPSASGMPNRWDSSKYPSTMHPSSMA